MAEVASRAVACRWPLICPYVGRISARDPPRVVVWMAGSDVGVERIRCGAGGAGPTVWGVPKSPELDPVEFNKRLLALREQGGGEMLLIGASLLDYALEKTLTFRLPNGASKHAKRLFNDPSAPLGSLGPKIDLAFALGLISEGTRSEAHRVRRVRNHFAHAYSPATFDDVDVRDHADAMKAAFVEDIDLGVTSEGQHLELDGGIVHLHNEDFQLSNVLVILSEEHAVQFLVPKLSREDLPSREAIVLHQLLVVSALVVAEGLFDWIDATRAIASTSSPNDPSA